MELVIGRVAKAHGITGELVVDVRTDDPDLRFIPGAVLSARPSRGGKPVSHEVETVRWHGNRLLVRLAGVADRTIADAMRGQLFIVDSTELPPIEDPDEFYDHQLEGLTVYADARPLGVVAEVLHTAGGELLAVKREAGAELLIPFVSAIVTSVSLADKRIDIEPPDGLLDLDALE